jgi:hypothetical protein
MMKRNQKVLVLKIQTVVAYKYKRNTTATSHTWNNTDFYVMDNTNKLWLDEHYGILSQHL